MLRSLNFTILQTCNLLSLSSMISKINTQLNKEMSVHPLVIIHFDSFERKVMNNLPRLPRIFIRNWVPACYSCGWFYPAAGYELRLSRGPVAEYDQVEFRRLDTSYGWLHPTADSSSACWIWVAADSVPRLTWVTAAGYELQLTTSYG